MFRRSGVLALAVLIGGAGTAPAQGMLDVLSSEAAFGVGVRNLNDLIRKGDKLIEETQLQLPLRPSQLFDIGLQQFLNIQGGLDRERPTVLMLLMPENVPQPPESLVVAVPFTDLDQMAANFGLGQGQLKPGKVVEAAAGRPFGKFVFASGRHVLLGDSEKALERVRKGRPASRDLSAERRKALDQADLLVYVNPRQTRGEWSKMMKELQAQLVKNAHDPKENDAIQTFVTDLETVRHFFAAVRVGGGLGVSFLADFPEAKDPNAFLAALGSGDGGSDLKGLPAGGVLAAQALRGDGEKGALVARAFIDHFLKELLETKQVISATDRPMFVGLFQEVWQRLRGSRWALYQNGDETRHGLFSLVAILDPEDARRFLADMRTLARLGAGKLELGKDKKDKGDVIAKLVKELGDPTYRVRQSATTKLRLIGEPALPHLEKVIAKADLETSRRAGRLRDQIAASAAERRKALLGKGVPALLRPSLTLFPEAEKIVGTRVDVFTLQLNEKDEGLAKQMQQLLGPDWNKVRLAAHGKQVVVMLGSDPELLGVTLKNLQEDQPGLAAAPGLANFHRLARPERKLEFHLALQSTAALVTDPANLPRPRPQPGQSLTSFSLAVEGRQLQLDLWLPSDEIRLLVRNKNFVP